MFDVSENKNTKPSKRPAPKLTLNQRQFEFEARITIARLFDTSFNLRKLSTGRSGFRERMKKKKKFKRCKDIQQSGG